MKMRTYLLVILLCVVLAPAALAFEQTADDGGCGTIDPDSPCYTTSTNKTCVKPYGCPLCAFNANTGGPVCFIVQGQFYGFCNCTPKGVGTDAAGTRIPTCIVSGGCRTTAR